MARKPPISTTQVELTVLTRGDMITQARIRCRYGADLEEVVLWLSAVEMDALVASWQRERARVIVSEGEAAGIAAAHGPTRGE